MTNPLDAFEPKHVQGLYNFAHYERADGAWYQVSCDPRRSEVTYCASPSRPFRTFANLEALRDFLSPPVTCIGCENPPLPGYRVCQACGEEGYR